MKATLKAKIIDNLKVYSNTRKKLDLYGSATKITEHFICSHHFSRAKKKQVKQMLINANQH